MNSPKNPQPLQRSPERGVRPGFILALSSLLATVLFSVWLYQRPKSPPTPSTEEVVAVAAPARTSSASTPRVATLKRSATDVHPMRPVAPAPTPAATLEERWGIQVCSMRLSMGNSIVDLRYKILNAEKAAPAR